LNLTAASYVVMFDPWWNPAVENQAIDRTHRIGQTSKVIAYRLLIKDSIEQKIRQLQLAKTALAENVLGEERFSQSLKIEDLRFSSAASNTKTRAPAQSRFLVQPPQSRPRARHPALLLFDPARRFTLS
jgi:hypothetical protein